MYESHRNGEGKISSNPTELLQEQVVLLRGISQSLKSQEQVLLLGAIKQSLLRLEDDSGFVEVSDIEMRFGSMVEFMVKSSIAVIPALLILGVLGAIVLTIFSALGIAVSGL